MRFSRSAPTAPAVLTLLDHSVRVQGDILFSGGLHLEGRIDGNLKAGAQLPSRVTIGSQGVVAGSVQADEVVLEGLVLGSIQASGAVRLGAGARIEGDLHYGSLEIQPGAQIKGSLRRLAGPQGDQSLESV